MEKANSLEPCVKLLRLFRTDMASRNRLQLISAPDLSPIALLRKEIELSERIEQEKIKKEIDLRRFRLGADPLPVLSEKVRTEIVAASDLELLILQILQSENDCALAEKCIERLQRKIPGTKDYSMTDKMLNLAKDYQSQSHMAKKIILDFADYSNHDAILRLQENGPYSELAVISSLSASELLSLSEKFAESPYASLLVVLEFWQRGDLHNTHRAIKNAKCLLLKISLDYGFAYPHCQLWLNRLEGLVLARGGSYKEAAIILVNIGATHDAEVTEALLKCYIATQNHAKAIDLIHRCLDTAPMDANLLSDLGWEYYCFGDLSKALLYLHQAVKLIDPIDSILFAETQLRLGKAYWDLNDESRRDRSICLQYFLTSARANPESSEAFLLLGQYYSAIGQDRQRAERCYAKALQLDPDCVEAAVALSALWLSQANRKTGMEETFLCIVRVLEPFGPLHYRNSRLWTNLGVALLQLDRYASATTAFQTALKGDHPDERRCLFGLGEGYRRQGRHNAAIKVYNRLLEIDPTCVTAKYGLAAVSSQMQEYENVQDLLAQVDEALGGYKIKIEILRSHVMQCEDYILMACVSQAIASASQAIILSTELMTKITAIDSSPLQCLIWKLVSQLCISIIKISKSHGFDSLDPGLERLSEDLAAKFDGNEIWDNIRTVMPPSLPRSCRMLIQISSLCQVNIIVESEEEAIVSTAWLDLAASLLECVSFSKALGHEVASGTLLLAMAKDCAEQAIDDSSGSNVLALLCLGSCHFVSEHYALAQHYLIEAIHADALLSPAHVALARLYSTLGDPELARLALAPVLIGPDSALGWQYQCILLAKPIETSPDMELPVVLRQASESSAASEHSIHMLHAIQMIKTIKALESAQRMESLMTIKIQAMRRMAFVPDCAVAQAILKILKDQDIFEQRDCSVASEETKLLYSRVTNGEMIEDEDRSQFLSQTATFEDPSRSDLWLQCFFTLPVDESSHLACQDYLESLRRYLVAMEKQPYCVSLWRDTHYWFLKSQGSAQQLMEDWLRLNITVELAQRLVSLPVIESIRGLWGEKLPPEIDQILRIHARFLANKVLTPFVD